MLVCMLKLGIYLTQKLFELYMLHELSIEFWYVFTRVIIIGSFNCIVQTQKIYKSIAIGLKHFKAVYWSIVRYTTTFCESIPKYGLSAKAMGDTGVLWLEVSWEFRHLVEYQCKWWRCDLFSCMPCVWGESSLYSSSDPFPSTMKPNLQSSSSRSLYVAAPPKIGLRQIYYGTHEGRTIPLSIAI